MGGTLFGVILNLIGTRHPDRMPRYGILGGAVVAIAILLIKASLGVGPADAWLSILWVTAVFVRSGCAIGWWLQQTRRGPAGIAGQALTRRQFLLRTDAASIAVTVSELGLTWLLSLRETTVTTMPTTGAAHVSSPRL